MTFFSRPLSVPHILAGTRLRPRMLLAATVAVAALALGGLTSPAGAEVIKVAGEDYGVQLHATAEDQFVPGALLEGSFTPLEYGLGRVMHARSVYAIYWDPAKLRPGDPGAPGKYHGDWQELINQFLHGVAVESGNTSNVFSITPQYTDSAGGKTGYSMTFRGAYVDHNSYPADGCTDPDESLNKNFACFTDAQLRSELASFITANGLKAGPETIFYLLTPPNVTVCLEELSERCSDSIATKPKSGRSGAEQASYEKSFCSYHAQTTVNGEQTIYAAVPWVAGTTGSALQPLGRSGSDCQAGNGIPQEPEQLATTGPDGFYDHALADIIINQVASQMTAMITNESFDGWFEPLSGREVPDQCRNWFMEPPVVSGAASPHPHTEAGDLANQIINGRAYYLNTEFNQAATYNEYPGIECVLGVQLIPSFTAPSPVNAGDIVGLDGNQSVVTLEQSADPTSTSQPLYRATFSWDFGDGTKESGPGYSEENPSAPLYASRFHAYTYGGTYIVTLTIKDVAGNVATTTREIAVVGPPPPGSPSGSGPGGSTAGSTGSTSGGSGSGGSGGSGSAKAPVATAAVLTRSLKGALKHGLLVSYSVDQQVTGHVEVLLSTGLARRLGIQAPAATSLAAGSSPRVVIAKAFIRTTKSGRSKITLQVSSKTARRLAHQRSLSLMLRLFVRNSANKSATVLSAFSLNH